MASMSESSSESSATSRRNSFSSTDSFEVSFTNSSSLSSGLWVFAYGSLCWRPGFESGGSVLGHVEGFARRFWQGNTTHRGTPDKPGRVATLTEERQAKTHGVALELPGPAALEYLEHRECTLGGYTKHIAHFRPKDKSLPAFPVLVFTANPHCRHWLGPACPRTIAEEVVTSRGPSGHNVEYVLRLAEWTRSVMPEVEDEHLFTIEMHIRDFIRHRKICLKVVMGDQTDPCSHHGAEHQVQQQDVQGQVQEQVQVAVSETPKETKRGSFASSISRKKLKCLNH